MGGQGMRRTAHQEDRKTILSWPAATLAAMAAIMPVSRLGSPSPSGRGLNYSRAWSCCPGHHGRKGASTPVLFLPSAGIVALGLGQGLLPTSPPLPLGWGLSGTFLGRMLQDM